MTSRNDCVLCGHVHSGNPQFDRKAESVLVPRLQIKGWELLLLGWESKNRVSELAECHRVSSSGAVLVRGWAGFLDPAIAVRLSSGAS